MAGSNGAPLANLSERRRQAREHLTDGAVTRNYQGDIATTIKLLNDALATEIVCVLRYRFQYATAQGIDSEGVKAEFLQHAQEEQGHADRLAERINQLGGKPDMNPASIAERSATEYVEGLNLVDMIKEDLVAERIAVETYRELIRYFGDRDPTTRRLLEEILAKEEEHANDMHDLLVSREGRPMLEH
jgi:bacterioferritin